MPQRVEVRFPSGETECAAWLHLPDGAGPAPAIVMGHGLGGVREMGAEAFAERFVAAGYVCLAFDYRHFGASGGEPRQLLSVRRQLEDWKAAIAFARGLPEVDPDRVVLWADSLGGGHVIATAAEIPVAAAIVQAPFTDGISSTFATPPLTSVRLVVLGLRDLAAMRRGRPRVMAPVYGEPGSVALMTAPDVAPGMRMLVPEGSSFRNEVTASGGFDILRYRPGARAAKVGCPLHVTVCDRDSVTPARTTTRHVNRAPHAEVVHRPVGHFALWQGAEFESVVADQLGFLHRHVPVGRA